MVLLNSEHLIVAYSTAVFRIDFMQNYTNELPLSGLSLIYARVFRLTFTSSHPTVSYALPSQPPLECTGTGLSHRRRRRWNPIDPRRQPDSHLSNCHALQPPFWCSASGAAVLELGRRTHRPVSHHMPSEHGVPVKAGPAK